jgi:CDGSH-type Zn-finger protein
MDEPIIADNKPVKVTLDKGEEYYFCRCGRSQDQPFCDGSHQGTAFSPLAFMAEKERNFLCMCKQTKTPPYCDGSHKALADSE